MSVSPIEEMTFESKIESIAVPLWFNYACVMNVLERESFHTWQSMTKQQSMLLLMWRLLLRSIQNILEYASIAMEIWIKKSICLWPLFQAWKVKATYQSAPWVWNFKSNFGSSYISNLKVCICKSFSSSLPMKKFVHFVVLQVFWKVDFEDVHVLHKCIEFNDVDVSVISNSYPITE